MEFIVMRSGQIQHVEPMLPGAQPTPVGVPAVEGEGSGEHLALNQLDGWKIEIRDLPHLLQVMESAQGQVTLRRPINFYLGRQMAYILDVTPGIGQS